MTRTRLQSKELLPPTSERRSAFLVQPPYAPRYFLLPPVVGVVALWVHAALCMASASGKGRCRAGASGGVDSCSREAGKDVGAGSGRGNATGKNVGSGMEDGGAGQGQGATADALASHTAAVQYFGELPNLSVVWNKKQNELELKWKDWDSRIFGDQRDDKILRASIASLPTIGDLQFSGDSVQKNFIESTGFDFNDFAWSELPEGQMAGAADALQTPGAVSNRLSFGMTPKTVRLPKNGEMLLSVHGSPLGVYKEDNLAAIRESGNGSEDAAS